MSLLLISFLLIAALLAACNLPGELKDLAQEAIATSTYTPSPEPTATRPSRTMDPNATETNPFVDLLSQLARLSATQLANQTQPSPSEVSASPVAMATEPAPSATVTEPSPSPAPTEPSATATAEPADPTQEPEPTPSPDPEDETSPFKRSKAAWQWDSDSGESPWKPDDENLKIKAEADSLLIEASGPAFWSNYPSSQDELGEGYYEMEFAFDSCSEGDRFGIAYQNTPDYHYYFGLSCEGNWGSTYYYGDEITLDLLYYLNPVDGYEPGQKIRVGVMLESGRQTFYVNGKFAADITGTVNAKPAGFGFHIMPVQFEGMSTRVYSYSVWMK